MLISQVRGFTSVSVLFVYDIIGRLESKGDALAELTTHSREQSTRNSFVCVNIRLELCLCHSCYKQGVQCESLPRVRFVKSYAGRLF